MLCTSCAIYLILGIVYFNPGFFKNVEGLVFQLNGCLCMLEASVSGIFLGLGHRDKTGGNLLLFAWVGHCISLSEVNAHLFTDLSHHIQRVQSAQPDHYRIYTDRGLEKAQEGFSCQTSIREPREPELSSSIGCHMPNLCGRVTPFFGVRTVWMRVFEMLWDTTYIQLLHGSSKGVSIVS